MKRDSLISILPVILILLATGVISCDKEPGSKYHGEFTIDNTLYGLGPYYAIGFSFEEGRTLQTIESPGPDITVHAKTDAQGNVSGAYLDTPNLEESYALAGDFDNEADARNFYDNLLEVGSYTWLLFADNISEHQVYVFKTRNDNYVKFRIRDLVLEDINDRAFAEVTIEWRIQPDGSATFSQ